MVKSNTVDTRLTDYLGGDPVYPSESYMLSRNLLVERTVSFSTQLIYARTRIYCIQYYIGMSPRYTPKSIHFIVFILFS